MGIGKLTAKAAGAAAGAVGEIMGTGGYPDTEFALATHLFERILGAERGKKDRDREYYCQLMYECLRTVRAAGKN